MKLAGVERRRCYGARFSIPIELGERGERCESIPPHKRGRGGGFREGSRRRHKRPRRSSWNSDFEPRLTKPSTQGGRGRQGELPTTLGAAVEGPTRHAPWPAAMELAGAPRTALRSASFRERNRRGGSGRGEEAHHGANSERKRLGTAAYARSTKNFPATVQTSGARARRRENGGGVVLRCARGSPTWRPRRGGSWRTWERGFGLGGCYWERGFGSDGWRKEVVLMGGPHPSAAREKSFSFLFSKQIFQTLFQMNFWIQNSFHQNHSSHKRNAPACMQQNISLTYI